MGVFRSAGPGGGGTVRAYDRLFENDIEIDRQHTGKAQDGMVVGVEILRPPWITGRRRAASWRSRIPGRAGRRSEDDHPQVRAARGLPAGRTGGRRAGSDRVSDEEIRSRENFRDQPIVTIDGETAMDFDDAVRVAKNADGTFELQVHIADVAHYVRPGGALDREAYERATSVYFPGTALPMLPHRLSNGICSLNPGVDRLVQSCLMTIDGRGRVVDYRFADGVIRSAERMTYTNVAKILVDRDPTIMERYRPLVPMFRAMEELFHVLTKRDAGAAASISTCPSPRFSWRPPER